MPSAQQGEQVDVVVLGAGVTGLSTAHELVDRGVKVVVVTKDLPEHVESTGFASPWAGANWSSFAVNKAEERRDEATFHRFRELAKSNPEFMTTTEFIYVANEDLFGNHWFKDLTPNYRRLPASEVPKPWTHGFGFTSFTYNAPLYLAHLARTLRAKGVRIIQHRVGSLDEAYCIPQVSSTPVKLVINATGLGSKTLLGVQDPKVYPARGQVVVAKGKGVRKLYGCRSGMPPGQSIYVIPRPGPDNLVVLGGTYVVNEWNTDPDPATAERILQNAFKICPALAGPPEEGKTKTWRDIEVVKHQVGLRPNREGGVRIELVHRKVGDGVKELTLLPKRVKDDVGREVGVVHAYGIGPAGYQASIGVAQEAAGLAVEYLKKGAGAVKGKSKL